MTKRHYDTDIAYRSAVRRGDRLADLSTIGGTFSGKPAKVKRAPVCKVCLQPEPLTKGICTDREACLERAPQLDLGLTEEA